MSAPTTTEQPASDTLSARGDEKAHTPRHARAQEEPPVTAEDGLGAPAKAEARAPQGAHSKPPHATRRRSIPYMPALDGLRAFAVLAVIAYHMGLTWAQGGLLGVTVFFVLSGFLITKLLLVEISSTGRLDFKNFYLRRARRLLPAIVVVIVCVAALCTLFNHPLLTKMRPDILPSLFFFNNWWQIFHDVSYFQALGAPSPLTHFWSLSIEEQFYFVWPLLLLCAIKLGATRKHLRAGITVLAALSILEMALLYNPDADPSRLYYGTDTRAFALLIGAFLATSTSGRRPRTSSHVRDALAAVSFVGLIALVAFSDGFSAFPYYGGLALCCVLSALFIYGTAAPDSGFMKRIFSIRPLVWVGERSYGMYLWHYPLILLLTPVNTASATPWWLPLLELALILGVSAFSYTYIETPVRRGALGKAWKKWRATRIIRINAKRCLAAGATAITLAIALAGLAFVPDTSVLSKEGAELLEQEQASNAAPRAEKTPEEQAAEEQAALEAARQEAVDEYVKTAMAAPADEFDTRSAEQRGFDARLAMTPLAEGAAPLLLIGDSVSLRSVPMFQETFPTSIINAEKNRQMEAGLSLYDEYNAAGQVGNVVVFSLGTNGFLTDERIDQTVAHVGTEKAIWFLTIRSPFNNPEISNETLQRAQERYPNIRVIDWAAASEGHEEYFDGDGTHLTDEGAWAFVGLIKEATKYEMPAE